MKSELLKKQRKIPVNEMFLTSEEKQILQNIRLQTARWNINNVTRTKAYLDFFCSYSDIQWAFLGHMVSRNGGWNMTDLKGDLISKLMNDETKNVFFSFLERGNWLIFQDAFPQFLLYAECVRRNKNLFYLLPYLNVSLFMQVIWEYYWRFRDRYVLAIAQVINEQSYLEHRIIHSPKYKDKVLNSFQFVLQDFLSVNHILFPFYNGNKITLLGQTLQQFDSLHERIMLGKRLYRILFHHSDQYEKFYHWATSNPHTGSRKDYWKNVFNDVNEGVPGKYSRRLKECQVKKGEPKLYSPILRIAWENVKHPEAELGDWYNHWDVINYLLEDDQDINGQIEGDYCEALEKLELAAMAKNIIFK
ncbi:DUF2515 family protein [Bacillus sp. FJAT-49732]|uniref:DUF2515 family protein n=1 Tax=Lederbergia citrisecunda TaxID=2833583 RepID=A0A942TIL8_9BACI|nr:DUF2515 family protein [Lederbergia citrisecunda]MBS4198720.1 DUF2515 family protein [Lederbergia citrisecunda]